MTQQPRVDPQARAFALAAKRDDVLLTREALDLGLSPWDVSRLRQAGGVSLPRGAVAIPPVRDPVRTSARAATLLVPSAAISCMTAARLHGLQGLPFWSPREALHLSVPRLRTRWQRAGLRLHFVTLNPAEVVDVAGLPVTSVPRTLLDCARVLDRSTFTALADSSLHRGLLCEQARQTLRTELSRRGITDAVWWLELAEAGSESPSESVVRLVLIDADLAPDELQYDVYTPSGFHVARLDMAWRRDGKKVGLEVDSAEHDRPRALYRDRERLNELRALGWDVRQVTAHDARKRPGYVVAQVRQALQMP